MTREPRRVPIQRTQADMALIAQVIAIKRLQAMGLGDTRFREVK